MEKITYNDLTESERRVHHRRRMLVILGASIFINGLILSSLDTVAMAKDFGVDVPPQLATAMNIVPAIMFGGLPSGFSHTYLLRQTYFMRLLASIPLFGWLGWFIIIFMCSFYSGWVFWIIDIAKLIARRALVTKNDNPKGGYESPRTAWIKTAVFLALVQVILIPVYMLYLDTDNFVHNLMPWYEETYKVEKEKRENGEFSSLPSSSSEPEITVSADGKLSLGSLKPTKASRYDDSGSVTYTYDGVSWDGALRFYPMINFYNPAWASYDIGSKYEKLNLMVTPYIGNETFDANASAELLIADGNSGKIIESLSLDRSTNNISVSADITGIDDLLVYVYSTSGVYGSVLIKDAELVPLSKPLADKKDDAVSAKTLERADELRVSEKVEKTFIADGYLWNNAYLFRPGNGGPDSYLVYEIGAKYKKLSIVAAPFIDSGNYSADAAVDITVKNEATGGILGSAKIDAKSGTVTLEADITGVNRLGIHADKTKGTLAYVIVRDIMLLP